jgi:hypothetical protein
MRLLSYILCLCIMGCMNRPKLNKDLLVNTICSSFQQDDLIETDSIKVARIFNKHLYPYLQGISQDSAYALKTFFYIRLQRECVVFKDIADRLNTQRKKSDWRSIDIEPESEINQEEFTTFFKVEHLKYLETNGDTSVAYVTDSTWEDYFQDGTYSRLKLSKINKSEFVITFVESNNKIRKILSKPGDKYRYKILKKDDGYYSMFVQPVGSKIKSLFKLYY